MNGDDLTRNPNSFSSYTPLEKVFHILATIGGRPDIIPSLKRQGLEDLYRQMQMKRWQQEEEEGQRPASLPIFKTKQIPSGGIGALPSGEIPQYDVPTEMRKEIGVEQIPIPGYKMRDISKLGGLANVYKMFGLAKTPTKTEPYGYGQRRDIETGEIVTVPTKPAPEVAKRPVQHVQQDKGDAIRYGIFDPNEPDESKAYKWGQWQKKGLAPQKPTEAEQGLTKGKIETLYANYQIARLKDKFDPMRLQMEEDFRDAGIEIPERMPDMNPQEFEAYVKTGKLPEKKKSLKPSKVYRYDAKGNLVTK
jgi:hypothetical protein